MHELRHRSSRLGLQATAILSLAMALSSTGCKSAPGAGPNGAQDDATLTQAVQGKLSADTALGNEPIQAAVQEGVATLSGSVSSDAARALAASDAAQISGIRTVVNNLVVHPSAVASVAPPPPPLIKREKPTRRPKPSAEDAPLPAPPPPPMAQRPAEPRQAAPVVRSVTLASGTTLPIRITQTLDSATTQEGATFSGVLASDVLADNLVVLPQGTPVSGRVMTVQEAAHFKGSSLLTIELTSLDRKGDHLPITTDSFSKAGKGRGKNSAEKIGGGAAVGAILGGIFGGGKGAAIGAAAGGGAGAGVQGLTKGQQVQIESESLVRFHLSNPITVRVATGSPSQNGHDDGDLQRHP